MKAAAVWTVVACLLVLPLTHVWAAEEGGHGEGGGLLEYALKVVNLLVVVGALTYLLRKPMKDFFAARRAAIRAAIQEAQQARQQSHERLADIERRLAGLAQEIEAMRKEAAENAAAEKQRIQESAQREAERLLETARAETASAGRAARMELRAYAARLAVTLAEQRIRQQLSPETHAALFRASVEEFHSPSAYGRH